MASQITRVLQSLQISSRFQAINAAESSRALATARRTPAAAPVVAIPEVPKKPKSSYLLFFSEHRPQLVKANPGISPAETVKRLAVQWKELNAREKQQYELRAKEASEKYAEVRSSFLSSLTPQQKASLQKLPIERKLRQAKRKLAALEKELDKPTSAGPGHVLFYKTQAQAGKKLDMAAVAAKWKALSDAEKSTYTAQSAEAQKKYKADLAKWSEKVSKGPKGEELTFLHDTIKKLSDKISQAK